MATDFTQESVLRFIIGHGGQVRNADLLTHFRRFLRDDDNREQNRELFKRYVNSVATVRQEEGVSHVVLRKKYRVHLGDIANKPEPERDVKTQAVLTVTSRVEILPAAGIVTNNNNNNNDSTPSFEKAVKTSSAHGKERPVDVTSAAKQVNNTCPVKQAPSDTDSRSSGSGQSFQQPSRELEHSSDKQRQLREADGCERTSVTHCAYFEVQASPLVDRKTTNTLESRHPDETWPSRPTLGQCHLYNSSPCLLDRPVSPQERSRMSRSNDSLLRSDRGFNGLPIREQDEYESEGLSVDDPPVAETYLQIHHPSSLSSSRDSISIPSPSPSPPPDTGWEFIHEEPSRVHGIGDGNDVRAFLRRNQEARLLSQLHQPNRDVPSMHHSTGHLDDDSRTSTRSSSPEIHRGPIARRMSSRLRSRMCRSLGEDLDQPFLEDNLTSRHNRLQLLSSTLSMGNLMSTSSSRGQSSRDLSSPAGSTQSLGVPGHDVSFSKHSSVPLEAREHDWFVKAASGSWTSIYSLFREDPNLLSKRDFISGFTVVHWIAKHGDHRVLNTLWYGVEKVGMSLDVNTKSLCGYTPLHLAAIHGHKKILRLLVQKFKADVRIRDSSGKRPWQYLSKDENWEILELLGAPLKRMSGCPTLPANLPARTSTAKVNVTRHSSIAALFKHKSHLRVSTASEAF